MTTPARRAARADLPVRIFRLGEEPVDDLSSTTTAEERLEMVALLSARMCELAGTPAPMYSRAEIPVRVTRGP